jgi:drug/metabolite transporter (DMT)-like permease
MTSVHPQESLVAAQGELAAASSRVVDPVTPSWGLAALIGANMLLPTGSVFVRIADVGPVSSAFWRLAIASPVLVVLVMLVEGARMPRLSRPVVVSIIASGVIFAADLASWHLGILRTNLANATLFGNSTSLFFPLWAFFAARAWPSRHEGAALLVAALGAMLLMGRSYQLSPEHLLGDVLSLFAGIFYTVFLVVIARARATLAPLPLLAASTLAGTLPMLAFALLMGERIWPQNWWPLLAMALFSQLAGQGLMIAVLGRVRPLVIGLALLVQPVVAAAIGWTLFGEQLGFADLLGATLVATALLLVRR